MPKTTLRQQLVEAQAMIQTLQEELAETNRGLLSLTLELEQRVDDRTAELHTAHNELWQTNAALIHLANELEDRVATRTAELVAKNEETASLTQQLWQTAKLATMGELVASIAHELNNPLAIVRIRVESLLMQVPEDDRKHRALTIIDQETERMGALVAQLLLFGRKSAPQISTINICDELEVTLELVHYHLRNHNVAVIRDYAPAVPMILADRKQMHQVFLNLINNACDAMPRGGTLTMRVRGSDPCPVEISSDAHSCIEILVEDTGEGIAPELLPKVMEAFFTTKPPGKGTGLGLSICKRTIEEFGGQMMLSSVAGAGTTVRIVFPTPQEPTAAGKTRLCRE